MSTTTETQLVTLTIDGQEVTVPAGTYILQAAESAGIEVPNLCFQPNLRPWGSCRVCTVEILGQRGGLETSCSTPVRDGMEVLTQSESVIQSRQFLLQMYLIDHALDCPTCDKSGECYLQDNTYLHNVDNNPYRRPKLAQPYAHFSDTIDYKWDRCIVCSRCTRVCAEMTGVTAIEIANRGLEAEVSVAYGIDLGDTLCTNCGMCIAVCPVGALTDRNFGHHPWELDSVETICGMCDVGCTINAEYTRGIVRRATHLWDRGVNEGYTCEFGRWGHIHVQDPTRLRYALLKTDDGQVEVDLDEALDVAAERLSHYQGSAFAALGTPANTNEDAYVLQQFTRAVMGSNNVDRLITSAQAGVDRALEKTFGVVANPAGINDMKTDSNAVLVVGPDIGKVGPVASYFVYWARKYREAAIVYISEDQIPLADRSNHWLKTSAGSEVDVLRAIGQLIVDEGLAAQDVDTSWLKGANPAEIAAANGIDFDLLRDSAILYATGGMGKEEGRTDYPPATIWHTFAAADGIDTEAATLAAHNLALLCDNVGQPGGGVLGFRMNANQQGTLDVGLHPSRLPGWETPDNQGAITSLQEIWSARWNAQAQRQNGFVQLRELPTEPGIGIDGIVDAINAGKIKAMYIAAQSHNRGDQKNGFFAASEDGYFFDGPSPLIGRGYDEELLTALSKLELLIVEDCFESELTELADVVLPTAMYIEKDGTFTSADRLVQRVRYVVAPPGEAQTSHRHLAEIAQRLGYAIESTNPSAIFDEIAMLTPGYQGISYPRLERGGLQWPVRNFGTQPSVRLSAGNGLDPNRVRIVAD